MSASSPPASEQAAMAEQFSAYRHPTAEEIKREVNAWKSLSVTAIAAENESVAEYIKQIESERDALRKLLDSCSAAMQENTMKYQVTDWSHMIAAIAAMQGKEE